MIYAQQEKQKEILNIIGIVLLSSAVIAALVFGFYVGVQMLGRPAPW